MRRLSAALCASAALLLSGTVAVADTKARKDLFARQSSILDKRLASRSSPSVPLGATEVYIPGAPTSEAIAKYNGVYRSRYETAARKAARRHNIPEDLFLRLVTQESAWNPKARSHKGAIGLAQLMPGTASYLRVNPHDPLQNLDGGAR
ncbi:MAG: lytic transglycosylase domain-containing protein, partial [Pseudomonadota bacterium]